MTRTTTTTDSTTNAHATRATTTNAATRVPATVDRRTFIKTAAAIGAALPLGSTSWLRAAGINEKLNVAGIGIGGMGWSDINQVAGHADVNIVGLCDIDANNMKRAAERYPNAKTFADYREMFAAMGDQIDAVTITTPDHMHAPPAMIALNNKQHVYCQKPLTHNIYESRRLLEASRTAGVATQMGIQGQAELYARQAVALIRGNHVGTVSHVYTWSDRPRNWWPQGGERRSGSDPVPDHVAWDLWLGVAQHRPYLDKAYHPFAWRGVIDFGTGALGDMGCHIFQRPCEGLELAAPTSVMAKTSGATADQYPLQEEVHYVFPGNKYSDGKPINLTWYDGGLKPTHQQLNLSDEEVEIPSNGVAIVGSEGTLMIPLYATPWLAPREKFASIEMPEFEPRNHWHHWVDACLGKVRNTDAGFEFAGPMTETVLLGALASLAPDQQLLWDSANLQITNVSDANKYIRRTYRDGWHVRGL